MADGGSPRAPIGRSNGPVTDQPDPAEPDPPDSNVVLRAGPLDGIRVRVHNRAPLTLEAGELLFTYRPLGEMDGEYPTLAVYVFDHAEAA